MFSHVLPLPQITVSSPQHPLTNGREGARQVAWVDLEAEGSTTSPCYPDNPPPSLPPFSCSVTLFPSLPGVDVEDLFSAAPVYVPKQGKDLAQPSSPHSRSLIYEALLLMC